MALVCILEAVKMHTMMKRILLAKKRTMAKTIHTTKRTTMIEFPKRICSDEEEEGKEESSSKREKG
jgi:hypothetical protein